MSEIYENAVDSLRIGMEFFLKEKSYSSRKHAILTIFHSIELFMKEYLYQINPLLIYKNIDAQITEDSFTAGVKDILVRLDNLGLGLRKPQRSVIENIQKRRNRIEHHRYDHKEEDEAIIAESLQFIMFFVDDVLKRKLESNIEPVLLREIQDIIFKHQELYGIAEYRLEKWLKEAWLDWDAQKEDSPVGFCGTVDCPICRQTFLVIAYHDKPFCFYCNTSVEAAECENCGITYLISLGCMWCDH